MGSRAQRLLPMPPARWLRSWPASLLSRHSAAASSSSSSAARSGAQLLGAAAACSGCGGGGPDPTSGSTMGGICAADVGPRRLACGGFLEGAGGAASGLEASCSGSSWDSSTFHCILCKCARHGVTSQAHRYINTTYNDAV